MNWYGRLATYHFWIKQEGMRRVEYDSRLGLYTGEVHRIAGMTRGNDVWEHDVVIWWLV